MSTLDSRPDQWRGFLGPAGLIWTAGLVLAVLPASRPVLSWLLITLAAWCASGAVALFLGRALQRLWLTRWERLGRKLIAARQHRWDTHSRLAQAAVAAEELQEASGHLRKRTSISLARPVAATWMADRWASLDARVLAAYGLDVFSTWPRLWLILPEPARGELRQAAAAWHGACVWGGWAFLYAALGIVWWPALMPAIVLGGWSWSRARGCLAARAILVESAYDLHGPDLAVPLGVQLPQSGRMEPGKGQEITARLRKGA